MDRKKIKELEDIAYAPYERIDKPTAEDWKKSYDALKELCELVPDEGMYPNTLGYSIPCAPAVRGRHLVRCQWPHRLYQQPRPYRRGL